ncbi:MAG: hypothetical protein JKY37_00220 [Nannocystaceae bacterium]|nr:hypothetical protein [Nannocystaceae bacterium]
MQQNLSPPDSHGVVALWHRWAHRVMSSGVRDDANERRRTYLALAFAAGTAPAIVVLAIAFAQQGAMLTGLGWVLLFATGVLILRLLPAASRTFWYSNGGVALLFIAITWSIHTRGGLGAQAVMALGLVPWLGIVLADRKSGIAWAVVCTAGVGLFALLENAGLAAPDQFSEQGIALMWTITPILVVVLATLLSLGQEAACHAATRDYGATRTGRANVVSELSRLFFGHSPANPARSEAAVSLRRRSRIVGNLLVAAIYATITVVGYLRGGLGAPSLLALAAVPMLAVLLAGSRSGVWWAVLAVGQIAAWTALDMRGAQLVDWLDPSDVWIADVIEPVVVITAMTWIGFSHETSRASFQRARHDSEGERIRAERVRSEDEARLLHTDRLASLGLLTATLAHEVNNPLMAVLFNLEMVSSALENAETEQDALAKRRTKEQALASRSVSTS